MQSNSSGYSNQYGVDRFIKFGKNRIVNKPDTTLVPNPISDLYYDQSILILDADAGIVDLSPNKTVLHNITGLSTVSSPTIIGKKSFDFTSERLEAPIPMSATKWTIRTWVYFLSFPSTYDATIFEWNSYTDGLLLRMDSGTRLGMWVEGGYYGVDPYPWATNKWYHLEWGYDNGNHYVFVDGILRTTFYRVATIPSSLGIGFTYHSGGGQRMNGYLQYFQVIQGVTAHTGNFDLEQVTPSKSLVQNYGLRYNSTVPIEHLNKRPVYNSNGLIVNLSNWGVNSARPKSRARYGYKTFNMLSLSPALWLNADDSSTLTLVSGAVSEWRDKSGNNRHVTQSTTGARPLFVANGLNNADVINFNGSTRLTHNYLATSQCTLFVVAKTNATSSWRCLGTFGSNLNFYINYYNANWGHYSSGDSGFNANSYSIMSIERTSTNIVYRHNSSNPVNKSLTTYNSGSAIGAANTSGSESGIFNLAQLILFSRVLTQAEREQVEGYLAWSTGLEANLPTNHPYKNTNP